jgi:signal transduction histidine kinase
VRGVVTCQQPSEFWIKDEALGLHILTRQKDGLNPGDEVAVLGFPRHGEYAPVLEDAVFRVLSHKTPPAPERLARVVEAFDHDAELVELEAVVLEQQQVLNGWTFAFRADNGTVFKALLRQTNAQPAPVESRPGSRVTVAGLCSVTRESGGPHSGLVQPQSFQLLLRSPADLRLIKPPPWWTRQRVIWLLGSITFVLLLTVAGVMLVARRRLLRQAAQRRMAEAEFSAILAERNRVAREIHDTLAQGLGAISLHLGLVKNKLGGSASDGVKKHLDLAYGVTRASLADARSAIFNMRSQVLEQGDLASALQGILRQMTDGTSVASHFEVTGRPRRLPPVTENALLRIGQEAIANAEKHGKAARIDVTLDYADKQVRLSVKDDGCGFDADRPPPSGGGFGLVGMRERAAQMQGELTIRSRPGEGTEIAFVVPAPSEAAPVS